MANYRSIIYNIGPTGFIFAGNAGAKTGPSFHKTCEELFFLDNFLENL
jgi:hypothetical protein